MACKGCVKSIKIGVFPKIGVFTPQIMNFNRLFHEINHPFWGVFPLFLEIPIWRFDSSTVHPHLRPPVAHATHEFVGSSVEPVAGVPTPLRKTNADGFQDLLGWIFMDNGYSMFLVL